MLQKEILLGLNRNEKQVVIEEIGKLAKKAQTLVMAQYRGLTVADMTQLRYAARQKGVSLSVWKNTLVRKALQGTPFEVVQEQMVGPLLYGFSEDPIAAAKVLADFSKTHEKLFIQVGVYAGKALQAGDVKKLADIPTKEVLLSQLLGLLQSPISRLACVLDAVSGQKAAA
jgi:large subunit ribosomal protein L10